jgi:hypothetical protein
MKRKSEKRAMDSNPYDNAESRQQNLNPSHEEIARLAYAYWEERACQGGSPEEDWYWAEREVLLRMKTTEPRINAAE